jgi:hypothetical protein
MLKQFLGTVVICKSEHQDFKKAKETAWDSANLGKKL